MPHPQITEKNGGVILICSTCGEVGHQKNCAKFRLGAENVTDNIDDKDSLLQNSIYEPFSYLTEIHQ